MKIRLEIQVITPGVCGAHDCEVCVGQLVPLYDFDECLEYFRTSVTLSLG